MFNRFLKVVIVLLGCFSCHAMDMEELKSRFLAGQPGGKVMQRDLRLKATVEIIDSSDASKKLIKWDWYFKGPLPLNYASDEVLTQPILTAMPCCPQAIRAELEKARCHLAFNFDIGGSIYGPVIGFSGFPVNDQNGKPGRCITIIDKNKLQTDIFW